MGGGGTGATPPCAGGGAGGGNHTAPHALEPIDPKKAAFAMLYTFGVFVVAMITWRLFHRLVKYAQHTGWWKAAHQRAEVRRRQLDREAWKPPVRRATSAVSSSRPSNASEAGLGSFKMKSGVGSALFSSVSSLKRRILPKSSLSRILMNKNGRSPSPSGSARRVSGANAAGGGGGGGGGGGARIDRAVSGLTRASKVGSMPLPPRRTNSAGFPGDAGPGGAAAALRREERQAATRQSSIRHLKSHTGVTGAFGGPAGRARLRQQEALRNRLWGLRASFRSIPNADPPPKSPVHIEGDILPDDQRRQLTDAADGGGDGGAPPSPVPEGANEPPASPRASPPAAGGGSDGLIGGEAKSRTSTHPGLICQQSVFDLSRKHTHIVETSVRRAGDKWAEDFGDNNKESRVQGAEPTPPARPPARPPSRDELAQRHRVASAQMGALKKVSDV